MFGTNESYNIKGYKWVGKNRPNKAGGGVGILISNNIANKISEVTDIEDTENLETTWVKLNTRPADIYIGVYYGPQESHNLEQTEKIYQYLQTQVKQLQTRGEIVIGGDFNAKVSVKNLQNQSRNGQLLQNMINETNLTNITTQAEIGKWTRVNRNKPEERSIIDYILMTEKIASTRGITTVDENGHLRVKGKHETDHNTLTTSIRINDKRRPTYIHKWKQGTNQQWDDFNRQLEEELRKGTLKPEDYTASEKTIKKALTKSIGRTKIRTDKAHKIKTDQIKKLKEDKKQKRGDFERACKEKVNQDQISETMRIYMTAQADHRKAVELEDKKRTEEKIMRLAKDAKQNRNLIWQIRKKTKTNNELEYNTITEEGKTLTDPEETKKYIQQWYQELYQARPGEPEYKVWTDKITQEVQKIASKHRKEDPTQGSEPISMKELNSAIKKLKPKKSTGPDEIPNEIFTKANQNTREIYLKMMNNIHKEEEIPDQWKKGLIKRLYKGKGTKGKCSNERGITLASNFGKTYERIINNRIKPLIKMTEAQAGGIEGNATVDHLIILKQVIDKIRREKKTAYIVFLDVKKAYDKAWLDAILYVLNKNGIEGKNWQMTRLMNTDLKANINTKYGPTQEISIKDSIRQGGVLSVIEYATMIDEISKELQRKDQGIDMENSKIGCLLWMDDVALIHHDRESLQQMLDTTNDIARRYHIEFGAEKCKVVRIGRGKQAKIMLNGQALEETTKYKYLGEIINNKANLKDHIEELKGKVQAAKQKIFTETGNREFKEMRMQAIWLLIDTTIIPILTYASEGWTITKKEQDDLQKILNSTLREVLKLPDSTPTTILLHETGYTHIGKIITKKKIMQNIRLESKNPSKLIRQVTGNNHSPWKEHVYELMKRYEISKDMEKRTASKEIDKKIQQETIEEIKEEAQTKSKIRDWVDNTQEIKPGTRPDYMNKLTRKQCTAILKVRSRMLPIKSNMKAKFTDSNCRWCKIATETQQHIMDECPIIKQKVKNQDIKHKDTYHNHPTEKMREIANHIISIIDIIE